jgi:hypothetical protein
MTLGEQRMVVGGRTSEMAVPSFIGTFQGFSGPCKDATQLLRSTVDRSQRYVETKGLPLM